jgi:hypothetical protein
MTTFIINASNSASYTDVGLYDAVNQDNVLVTVDGFIANSLGGDINLSAGSSTVAIAGTLTTFGDNGVVCGVANAPLIPNAPPGLSEVGGNWISIAATGSITANWDVLAFGGYNQISNAGTLVAGAGDGLVAGGVFNQISNSGSITAAVYGIKLAIDNGEVSGVVTNTGSITAENVGIYDQGGGALTNSGSIHGGGPGIPIQHIDAPSGGAGVDIHGTGSSLHNSGAIDGYGVGVYISAGAGASNTIVNDGTISGGTFAIEAIGGNVSVTNSGLIQGAVSLGAGNNTLTIAGGSITGLVDLGGGDDTAVWHGNASNYGITFDVPQQAFVVTDNRSGSPDGSVTIANVETLQFAGSTLHTLVGAGSGVLTGTSGADIIVGEASNIMTGGAGQDTFVFQPGFGKDVVTDFTTTGATHDIVDLEHTGITSFQQLLNHNIAQNGHNVVITIDAADSLTLQNVKLSDLKAHPEDFHFA